MLLYWYLLLGIYFYAQNAQKEDVVYIDVNVLMADYEGMKDAKKEFEEKSKVWQANVDSLIADFQNELKVYEKGTFCNDQKRERT